MQAEEVKYDFEGRTQDPDYCRTVKTAAGCCQVQGLSQKVFQLCLKKKVIPFTSYSDSLSVLFTVQWRAKVFTPLRQNENDRNHIPFTITSKKNVKILIANNLNDICSQVSFVSVFLLNFPHVLD